MTSVERVRHLWWLPAILALADIGITLYRQPAGYWSGNYAAAFDFNPVVVVALQHSPWWALPGAIGWLIAIVVGLWILSDRWSRRLFVFLSVTHFICVAGWLVRWDLRLLWGIIPVGGISAYVGARAWAKVQPVTGETRAISPSSDQSRS